MPELPDLEVFSFNLSGRLAGKKVEKLRAIYRKKLKTPEKKFRKSVEGATLTSVYRDGKELHFAFDNGNVISLHLMLKGRLHLFEKTHDEKYPIIEIRFSDGTGLVLTDSQRQAKPALNPPAREAPDALSKTVNYTFLKGTLHRSKARIKQLMMDQKIIRGIGNAYADEILWHARISPFSVSNKIPGQAIKRLAKSVRPVLTNAIKTILKNYPGMIAGEVRDFMTVHNAKKGRSPTGAKIKVDKTGRSTYYTDEQKLYK